MTTKERILYEALTLFSEKGYKGTSVKNIADAVGVKDSSLYKHYKSKQEILDVIMIEIKKHIEKMSEEIGLPTGRDYKKAAEFYKALDEKGLVEFSKKIFLFYMNDKLLSKFWKMGIIEQFQNNQVSVVFRKFFFEDSIQYQKELFAEMSKQKIFITADPEVMAINFFAPIFFLLSKYSGLKENKEESLIILENQVREFYLIYKKK